MQAPNLKYSTRSGKHDIKYNRNNYSDSDDRILENCE